MKYEPHLGNPDRGVVIQEALERARGVAGRQDLDRK